MKTKTKGATKPTPEFTWQKIHAAYLVSPGEDGPDLRFPPDLRPLAQRFGVRLVDLKDRAWTESWELEWKAEGARAWHRKCGHGAQSEAEFCTRYMEHAAKDPRLAFARLIREVGPEARALMHAEARELWWRIMPPVFEWEAERQIRRAKGAIQVIQDERNRLQRAGLYIDENGADLPEAA